MEYWEVKRGQSPAFQLVTTSSDELHRLQADARGRARWKIENEDVQYLKNQGQLDQITAWRAASLSGVCHADDAGVSVDQTQQLCCALFQAVWHQLGK